MAISRGAGTEIIRSAHFKELDGVAAHKLIFGVQHHIYTVLSVIIYCVSKQATINIIDLSILGYDAQAGTSARTIKIFRENIAANETFAWNDKFSFNGHEPVDFTGPIDSVAKQDAIADQGSLVPQYLTLGSTHADDYFQVSITYIDQNNA
tara:strand:- start:38 stop:490 length:453 start_codon:yes stop_codon:yes gene_type:complete